MSMRAIAREVGIVPSAPYRYFPSREAVITELIATTFEEIHELLDGAVTHALADHPTDPVAAEPLFRIVVVALQNGLVDRDAMAVAARSRSAVMREGVIADAQRRGLEVPDEVVASVVAAALGAWAELQGLVGMELLGHLAPVEPFAEEFFRRASTGVIQRVLR